MTFSQANALTCLAGRGEMLVSGLAAVLGCDAGGVSRLVDGLEVKGFVAWRHHCGDRRTKQLSLTHEGMVVADLIHSLVMQVEQSLIKVLTGDERDFLCSLLRRILQGDPASGA